MWGSHCQAPVSRNRPGTQARDHMHWVFPVCSPAPDRLVALLRRAGYDASAKTSAIAVVPAPADRSDLYPEAAARMLRDVVFLPVYPQLGEDLARLADVMR